MSIRPSRVVLLLFLFLSLAALAGLTTAEPAPQDSVPSAVDKAVSYRARALEAQRQHEAQSYERSAELLGQLVEEFPGDGGHWQMLGEAHDQLGEWAAAIRAFEQARELGTLSVADAACRIAEVHAASGEKDDAFAALRSCLAAGYRFRGSLARNPRFEGLSDDPRFEELLGTSPEPQLDRDEGWRRDLGFLVDALRRVHFEYRSKPFPATFLARVQDLRESIPRLTDAQVVVELQRLLATLGDGHTVIVPLGMSRGNLARLPIGLWWFSDGLHVVATSAENADLLGAKVTAFGSQSADRTLERLRELVSHDNPSGYRWVAPVYVTFTDYLVAAGSIPGPERATLTFELPDGGRLERTLAASADADPSTLVLQLIAPPGVQPPLHLEHLDRVYRLEEIGEGVVYLQLNQVRNGPDASLAEIAHSLRRRVTENDARTVILDLRHNRGGDAGLLPELIRTLVHLDTADPQRQLFVLTSRNTFSAAQTLLNLLEGLTSALFVGEPSGTRPNRLGNEAPFRLPFSGVRGSISSGYNQGWSSRDERIWIAPQVPVPLSSRDYFAGRDPVLDTVLKLAASPSGPAPEAAP